MLAISNNTIMRPEYKQFVRKAKELGVGTIKELYELACDMAHLDLTGGEFECAKKELKIRS